VTAAVRSRRQSDNRSQLSTIAETTPREQFRRERPGGLHTDPAKLQEAISKLLAVGAFVGFQVRLAKPFRSLFFEFSDLAHAELQSLKLHRQSFPKMLAEGLSIASSESVEPLEKP